MFTDILFDLDGTLTDPKDGIVRCIQYSLNQLGIIAPDVDQLTWCIGPPLKSSFSVLLNTSDEALLNLAISYYRKRFSDIGIYENVLYPEAIPALKKIKDTGYRIFLATSKLKEYAKIILDHFNLTQFFHAIYGSELDGRLTDKGDLVAHIIDTEKLNRKTTLIAGDRSYDILGGKKNGILTVALTYGYGNPEEFAVSKPDYIFESLHDLAIFLESNLIYV